MPCYITKSEDMEAFRSLLNPRMNIAWRQYSMGMEQDGTTTIVQIQSPFNGRCHAYDLFISRIIFALRGNQPSVKACLTELLQALMDLDDYMSERRLNGDVRWVNFRNLAHGIRDELNRRKQVEMEAENA